MSTVDPSPTDLPAISYIRVASVDPNDAARAVERQRAQIALAARHLGLRLVDEFALLHVRTSRILKHRVRPHLTGLPDSLD
jgi:hypothetical protein